MSNMVIGKVDDLNLLLNLLPKHLYNYLQASPDLENLIEIVLDLGFCPEVRFSHNVHRLQDLGEITQEHINSVISRVGDFNHDNRAGIERTLHRISALKNRTGKVIGLTCRIGRAVEGTVDIIQDIVESGQNCLFLGPPGIGKTTLLREVARVLSTKAQKRVVVVDTSNEIAGDGDIPHPGIGYARRMQVPKPSLQHATMIEAVENHMPEVIVVDEIGTEEETKACRTIAERGVQLVGTAHGYQLENLIKNPILADLIGGFQNVVLGDEEAKFRGTNKTVIERKGPPTFDVIIELHARDIFIIYNPVAKYIDAYLNNDSIEGELRKRKKDGQVTITKEIPIKNKEISPQEEKAIFPFGISTKKLKDIGKSLGIPLKIVSEINEADLILTTKSKTGPKSKVSQLARAHQLSLHIITSQEEEKLIKFLHSLFNVTPNTDYEEEVRRETKLACEEVLKESSFVELPPQPIYLRTIQHEIAHHYGLNSMSVGESPNRRLRVYPRI